MMDEWIPYLVEFRKRLLRVLILYALIFLPLSFFANRIYDLFTFPILRYLPEHPALIATSISAPFLVPFQSVLFASFIVTVPYMLYELWRFIAPALYRQERKILWVLLLSSTLLFYLGIIFSYFLVLPILSKFFISIAPASVEVKPDIGQYFSFMVKIFLTFGFAFEVPVVLMMMVRMGICSRESLASKRPYMLILAFVLGMLFAPPDIFSQTLLALPLYLLFEIGLWLSRYMIKSAEAEEITNSR